MNCKEDFKMRRICYVGRKLTHLTVSRFSLVSWRCRWSCPKHTKCLWNGALCARRCMKCTETCASSLPRTPTHHISSGEDDGQAKGWDDYACREEDGQLLAGVAGRVCVVHHPPRDAVRDGAEDVEEEQKQRPVCAAETRKCKGGACFNGA